MRGRRHGRDEGNERDEAWGRVSGRRRGRCERDERHGRDEGDERGEKDEA